MRLTRPLSRTLHSRHRSPDRDRERERETLINIRSFPHHHPTVVLLRSRNNRRPPLLLLLLLVFSLSFSCTHTSRLWLTLRIETHVIYAPRIGAWLNEKNILGEYVHGFYRRK